MAATLAFYHVPLLNNTLPLSGLLLHVPPGELVDKSVLMITGAGDSFATLLPVNICWSNEGFPYYKLVLDLRLLQVYDCS